MLDLVSHVVREIGPASVSVWTWAVADYEVEAMAGLMASSAITSGRLVVDRSAEQRSVETIEAWRTRFGAEQVRVCKNDAKICVGVDGGSACADSGLDESQLESALRAGGHL